MLFNSYIFLFVFLPVCLACFWSLRKRKQNLAILFLALTSLAFYAWWSIQALPILTLSIAVNYQFGCALSYNARRGAKNNAVLVAAIGANLLALGYFKYTAFILESWNILADSWALSTFQAPQIVLPIGISFFTFTQIAYLVDCHRGTVRERSIVHYTLFVSYFPHILAGPVLHHAQLMPQFRNSSSAPINAQSLAFGILSFTIGLAKKLLLADPLGKYADALANGAAANDVPMLLMSWTGALAYAFQIYYDFSGYSDMAIGVSSMLGITLPMNFNSPYKAWNIIEFWRRWHISLSTFLRDYLYIPLGGNRFGAQRRYTNVMITMLLGGLWHGANWTFVVWGGAHGLFLLLNHAWRASPLGQLTRDGKLKGLCMAFTFLCVCIAWVPFRAENMLTAGKVLSGMFGANGMSLPPSLADYPALAALAGSLGVTFSQHVSNAPSPELAPLLLLAAGAIAFFTPASHVVAARLATEPEPGLRRRMAAAYALAGLLLFVCILRLDRESPFLYFQF